jgi:hypothetical protein
VHTSMKDAGRKFMLCLLGYWISVFRTKIS